jgi:hypothetical protein
MTAQVAAVGAAAQVAPEQGTAPAQGSTASPETQTPKADSSVDPAKLAEAEKRLKDTQAWAHKKAQEAAQLRSELNMVLKTPAFQQALDSLGQTTEGKTPEQTQADYELQAAFREYAASPSDEAAFQKLIAIASERGRRGAVKDFQQMLERRDAEQAVRQRNQLARNTIERTVEQIAPDVPLELFWAMAERAEMETPAQLTEEAARLTWQTDRAVALARQIMWTKLQRLRQATATQQRVNQAGQATMPAGGASPVPAGTQQVQIRTLADAIKDRQAKLAGS